MLYYFPQLIPLIQYSVFSIKTNFKFLNRIKSSQSPLQKICRGLFYRSDQFRVYVDGAMIGDGEGGFVVGDAVDEGFDCVRGDEDEVDGCALGAGAAGDAVEGVDAGGRADGRNVGAVGQDILHIPDRVAFRVGVEVAGDENGEVGTVFCAELVLLFEHLADVIDAPHLALDGVGRLEVVGFQDQRAVGVDQRKLFAAFLIGKDCPRHRFGIGAAAAVKLAAALEQFKTVVAVENGGIAMLILRVAQCDGSINVGKRLKKCGSDAIDLLHTDQIGIACAIVIGNQGESVLKGLIKQNVAGHYANVSIRGAGKQSRHSVFLSVQLLHNNGGKVEEGGEILHLIDGGVVDDGAVVGRAGVAELFEELGKGCGGLEPASDLRFENVGGHVEHLDG